MCVIWLKSFRRKKGWLGYNLSGYQPKTLSVFARISSSSSGGWRRQRTLCVPPLAVGSLAIHRSQLFEEEHYTSRAREVRAAVGFL